MSACKVEYEMRIPKEQQTPAKWHIWVYAWNAAIRTITNDTVQLREPL